MTGTPSARPIKSNMFAQDEILSTRHQILKKNHEILVRDYESLEKRFKHVKEMNGMMKLYVHNQTIELEAKNTRLVKDIERGIKEKEDYKKKVEKIENERNAIIDDLMIKNQELLIAKEKGEEDLMEIKNKYDILTERFRAAETECSYLKSLYDDENLIGQRGNNSEVVLVDNNVNNTVKDVIVISDGSDDEHDNTPRESNIIPQWFVPIKQKEQCSNGVNSSKLNHGSSSSSSSSSSDEYVVVKFPIKKPEG